MQRVPEPELMDTAEQARAYAEADFAGTDDALFAGIVARLPQAPRRVLDLGCGPGNLAIRFARAYPDAHVEAVDGSSAMLAHARRVVREEGLEVQLVEALVQDYSPESPFDLIVSNSLLHHLHAPEVLWRAVLRCGSPGALVVVSDLRRPADSNTLQSIAQTHGAGQEPVLRRDFEASLRAAFEPSEVEAQLRQAGLAGFSVLIPTDRHLRVVGSLPA